jgi:hypothetical protein
MSNSSDVLFFNATVNNDTASIAAAINEEDMNIDCSFANTFNAKILAKQNDYDMSICRLVIPSDTIDLLNINSNNADDYRVGLSYETKLSTSDTKLTKAVQLSQLPKSANSSSSNYPYSYRSSGDVIEGVNRALAYSHFNMCYDIAQTTQAESGYGYHYLNLSASSFDTSVSNVYTFPTYTPNPLETRVCGVRLSLQMTVTSPGVPFSIILGNANNECLITSTSTNQPEYNQLYNTSFAEYGVCSIYKGINVSPSYGNTVFYPQESFLSFNTNSSGGSWYLSIVNTSNSTVAKKVTGNIVARLEIIELANVPSSPPVFGITATNKLEFRNSNYMEQ